MSGHAASGVSVGVLCLAVVLGVAYELATLRGAARGRPWPNWRGAVFTAGCAVLAVAAVLPAHHFPGHMTRHVLIGMVAPIALVLGAPVTALLRSLPAPRARLLSRVLRSGPLRRVTHPVTALALTVGSLYAVYLTPLYARLHHDPAWHQTMDLHFLLSGFLFAWAVAGPDPAPHRASVRCRLVVLGVAITAHAGLAQLLYAGVGVAVPGTVADRQAGATIMYYLGDIAELVLAFAVVAARSPVRARPGHARDAGPTWPGRVRRWPGRVTAAGIRPAYGRAHGWRT